MPTKQELATEFLHEIEGQGEKLTFTRETKRIVLKSAKEAKGLSLWRLHWMILQFLTAHAALSYASVSDVVEALLSSIV
jgi:hypothetical protein